MTPAMLRRILFCAMTAVPCAALAQAFPSKALRVIVPQPPGGGFDLVARTLAEPLARELGQAVIVENRPGSGTVIGTDAVAKADADGYTILLGASANLVFTPALYRKLPFDAKADFVPVGLAAGFAYTVVMRGDSQLGSLKEVVEYARANPGKLTYASAGNGSGQHICGALFWHLANANVTHVPYKGAQAAYQDLIPGRVDIFFDASSTARAQVEGGRVKGIAVTGPARFPYHPGIPTIRETGALDFEFETWAGYFVRAGTPPAALSRLRAEFAKIVAQPEVVARIEKSGLRVLRLSPEEAGALVDRDMEKWGKLIRAAGIQAD